MHLSGKSNAGDLLLLNTGFGERLGNGNLCRTPPVIGILVRPTDSRRGKGLMFFSNGGKNPPMLVDNNCARTAGAYVDSENTRFHSVIPVVYPSRRLPMTSRPTAATRI